MIATASPATTVLERFGASNPGLEIWWDSSPLVFESWRSRMIESAEPERRDEVAADLARLWDPDDLATTEFRGATTNPPLSLAAMRHDPERWAAWIRGGWLALQYTLDRKPDLASLVISSSPPSVDRAVREMNELRAQLPHDAQRVLADHETRQFFDCPEYTAAIMAFYKRHLCRLEPWPEIVERSMGPSFGAGPYLTMWGPSEFGPVTGNLKGWDLTDRLGELRVPTLLTVGRHDEMRPSHMADMQARIRGSELVIFENSSHMAFVEEREAYMETMTRFLDRSEQN